MNDEEKEWKARFSENWKLEDGKIYPSRASMYLVSGIKKEYEKADSNILFALAGSSLFQPMYGVMAKMIDKKEKTEVECARILEEMGKELGKEIAKGREFKNERN